MAQLSARGGASLDTGFHVGRRYRGIGEAPDFLMYYETEDSKVMAGKPYQLAINNPTPGLKR
jgi:hypothetical protein